MNELQILYGFKAIEIYDVKNGLESFAQKVLLKKKGGKQFLIRPLVFKKLISLVPDKRF